MENSISEEVKINNINDFNNLHNSINHLIRTNNLSFSEENDSSWRNRSCSMSINYPKKFVPKLKPIKTALCPSPINLTQNLSITEVQNTSSSTFNESQKDLNLMQSKYLYSNKAKKKSFKIMNIEEETRECEAMSDNEDKSKKINILYSDSDTSENDDGGGENTSGRGGVVGGLIHNIKIIRQKMMRIRKNSAYTEGIIDDSNIDSGLRSSRYKYIRAQRFIDKIKKMKNMHLNPLELTNKYRTKSFSAKQDYVSTILGFLERSHSSLSLNSNEK
jgi:hypothetical protein